MSDNTNLPAPGSDPTEEAVAQLWQAVADITDDAEALVFSKTYMGPEIQNRDAWSSLFVAYNATQVEAGKANQAARLIAAKAAQAAPVTPQ